MHIEELKERKEGQEGKEEFSGSCELLHEVDKATVVWWDVKRVLVGAGARALFYPTLLYNVIRNKVQAEFRWWDWIDEFVLLGAVPFPSDIQRLKELGVCGVVTMNESYETLIPPTLYEANGMHHLVLPTRDYLFAPSLLDICQAVDFIQENALHGRRTYVHCKAGRGRSTTIVICYLVKYRKMSPDIAYDYVKSIRPRVLLASSQWKAVQEFYHLKAKGTGLNQLTGLSARSPRFLAAQDLSSFDDGTVVVVSEADLDGYTSGNQSDVSRNKICAGVSLIYPVSRNKICAGVSLIYPVKVVREAALARLSCLWLCFHSHQKISSERLTGDGGCVRASKLGNLTVDIHVFS